MVATFVCLTGMITELKRNKVKARLKYPYPFPLIS